jgi:hypothetical protein
MKRQQEEQVRIQMLDAIADSQYAMARILHAISDVTEQNPALTLLIAKNMNQLADMQASMNEVVHDIKTMQSLRSGRVAPSPLHIGNNKLKKRKKQTKPLVLVGAMKPSDKINPAAAQLDTYESKEASKT